MTKTKRSQKKVQKKKNKSKAIYLVPIILIVLVLFFALKDMIINETPTPYSKNTALNYEFEKEGELDFFNTSGEKITTIDLEFARKSYEIETGLMNRESMGKNEGMLFIFNYEFEQSFWMKNTKISLDMIFVNSAKKIVTIHKSTVPYAEDSYKSTENAQFVIEVNAGFTDANGIEVGDSVDWRESGFSSR